MNNRFVLFTLAGLAALALVSSDLHAQDRMATSCCALQNPLNQSVPVAARQTKGVQKATITVSNGAYAPASVTVKAGKPVELTFVKGENAGCGSTVVFPGLKISKELTAQKTVFAFTPKKVGQLAFTCSMGMYRGSVAVK